MTPINPTKVNSINLTKWHILIPIPKSTFFPLAPPVPQISMLKLEKGPAPMNVTLQTGQFKEMAYLPLSEQFETIQNQTELEVIAEV